MVSASAAGKNRERHDPSHAIEAGRRGRGQHGVAVLLHEALQHQGIAVAALDAGNQLVAHALGVGAADMVAFQQNLVAAAHAHQAVSQFVEAGVAVGAEEGDGQQCDEQELGDAKFRVSSFEFQVINTSNPCLKGTPSRAPIRF